MKAGERSSFWTTSKGGLLAATRNGKLQVIAFEDDGSNVLCEEDLTRFEPHTAPSPGVARH